MAIQWDLYTNIYIYIWMSHPSKAPPGNSKALLSRSGAAGTGFIEVFKRTSVLQPD